MPDNSRFIIHQGSPPGFYSQGFILPVYYHDAYLQLHQIPESSCYYLLDTENRLIAGKVVLHPSGDGVPVSMPGAPFGSFHHIESLPADVTEQWVRETMIKGAIVRHPSDIYLSAESMTGEILKKPDNAMMISDINQHIPLQDFGKGSMHPMQLRRIRKCQQAGFRCEQITEIPDLEKVYDFLRQCRIDQGLVINISEEMFLESFRQLPDHYFAFVVYDGENTLVAATVTISVTNDIMYNYLPGSLRSYNSFSPMTFLLNCLVIFMKRHHYRILDLGVSSIDGEEQTGLARFKDRMGAVRTDKLTFRIL